MNRAGSPGNRVQLFENRALVRPQRATRTQQK